MRIVDGAFTFVRNVTAFRDESHEYQMSGICRG
jgi:hypothetical protein